MDLADFRELVDKGLLGAAQALVHNPSPPVDAPEPETTQEPDPETTQEPDPEITQEPDPVAVQLIRNADLVRAVLRARLEGDDQALAKFLAEEVVLVAPSGERHVGWVDVIDHWNRQAELLDEIDYKAELLDFAATSNHVFTYVKVQARVKDRAYTHATLTAYRVLEGLVVEVVPHYQPRSDYIDFWKSLSSRPAKIVEQP
jgi:hypothetical protein